MRVGYFLCLRVPLLQQAVSRGNMVGTKNLGNSFSVRSERKEGTCICVGAGAEFAGKTKAKSRIMGISICISYILINRESSTVSVSSNWGSGGVSSTFLY